MNNIKEKIANAMGMLSSDRDVVSSAKIRAAAEHRKIPAKRILGTAAAVCGVLICGVTAAAATGLIDFETVFGNRITVKDSELASSLVSTADNFKYKVSDNDYKIEIKGVTGDDKNVVVAAEISRKDGTPVTDCFVNPLPPDEKQLVTLSQNVDIMAKLPYSYSIDYGINSSGNIDLFIDLGGIGSGFDGSKMIFKGENFYPAGAYIDFKYNNPSEAACTEYTYTQYGESGGGKNVSADLNDILALGLKWEFSFTYRQSDKSRQVKSLNAPEENFPLDLSVHKVGTEDEFVCSLTAKPSYIEAGSTGGRVDFEYETTGYEGNLDYVTDFAENNEVYIIMSDGRRVHSSFNGYSVFPDGNICICSSEITYWDDDDHIIFINADDITSISINGVIYELK